MASEVPAGTIHAGDVEQLNHCVWPWDLRMNQMSRGQLRANLDFAQVNGVFLTRERWSHSIAATGATPAGYLALGGSCTNKGFHWSGEHIGDRRIVCALDATETQFTTPDEEDHWVMLVPVEQIFRRLGDDVAARLSGIRSVFVNDPRLIRQLGDLVVRTVAGSGEGRSSRVDDQSINEIHFQFLEAVTGILVSGGAGVDHGSAKKRYLAFLRALRFAEKLRHPVGVDELAAQSGVHRRVLEMAFRENLGVSPSAYLRRVRLNGMRRDLLRTSPKSNTVTSLALKWGFSEMGRTATMYRKLFGESPSESLRHGMGPQAIRFEDVLHPSSHG